MELDKTEHYKLSLPGNDDPVEISVLDENFKTLDEKLHDETEKLRAYAATGPDSSVNGDIVLFGGTDGRTLKDSGRSFPLKTDDISDKAVTEGKLSDKAVSEDKLQAGSVSQGKIKDGAVTEGKLSDKAVSADKIQAGAVTQPKIQDGAVTEGKIADGAVSVSKVKPADARNKALVTVYENNRLETHWREIDSSIIMDGQVNTAELADKAVSADKIQAGAVTQPKIQDGAVTEGKLHDGAVTSAKLADNAVTSGKIADHTVQKSDLTDGVVEWIEASGVKNLGIVYAEYFQEGGSFIAHVTIEGYSPNAGAVIIARLCPKIGEESLWRERPRPLNLTVSGVGGSIVLDDGSFNFTTIFPEDEYICCVLSAMAQGAYVWRVVNAKTALEVNELKSKYADLYGCAKYLGSGSMNGINFLEHLLVNWPIKRGMFLGVTGDGIIGMTNKDIYKGDIIICKKDVPNDGSVQAADVAGDLFDQYFDIISDGGGGELPSDVVRASQDITAGRLVKGIADSKYVAQTDFMEDDVVLMTEKPTAGHIITAAGDGKWVKDSGFTIEKSVPKDAKFTDTTYGNVTTNSHGLMTSADKKKLDEIVLSDILKYQNYAKDTSMWGLMLHKTRGRLNILKWQNSDDIVQVVIPADVELYYKDYNTASGCTTLSASDFESQMKTLTREPLDSRHAGFAKFKCASKQNYTDAEGYCYIIALPRDRVLYWNITDKKLWATTIYAWQSNISDRVTHIPLLFTCPLRRGAANNTLFSGMNIPEGIDAEKSVTSGNMGTLEYLNGTIIGGEWYPYFYNGGTITELSGEFESI